MKVATVYGATHGLGLATAKQLLNSGFRVELIGRNFDLVDQLLMGDENIAKNARPIRHDLIKDNIEDLLLEVHQEPDAIFYTAGIGQLGSFSDSSKQYVENCFHLNSIVPAIIIKHHFTQIESNRDLYIGIATSIAGQLVSPLFSVYAASKAATSRLIESINIELLAGGHKNVITDYCPGNFQGSSFYGGTTDLDKLAELASDFIDTTLEKTPFKIPKYDEIYKSVIDRYNTDKTAFGISSYEFKLNRSKNSE